MGLYQRQQAPCMVIVTMGQDDGIGLETIDATAPGIFHKHVRAAGIEEDRFTPVFKPGRKTRFGAVAASADGVVIDENG